MLTAPTSAPGLPQELWPVVFANAHEAILISDVAGLIVDVNPAFTRITGYARDEAVGQTTRLLKSGYQDSAFYAKMWRALGAEGRWQGEIWNRRKDGSVFPEFVTISAIREADGDIGHFIAIFYDIGFVREQTDRFKHLAHHDVLTGLPNRLALNLMLPQAIQRARRQGTQLIVGVLDLDDFKPVNDQHGHKAGDDLLRLFAQRLRDSMRATDFVARLGGDEFVVLLKDIDSDDEIHGCLQRIGRICDTAFMLPAGLEIRIGLSLGWTAFPEDDPNNTEAPELLLRNADMALYVAKANKGDRAFRQRRWGQTTGAEVLARAAPMVVGYGAASRRLLHLGADHLAQATQTFVDGFYASLNADAHSHALLAALTTDEMAALGNSQRAHLRWLLAPELDEPAHARRTAHVGQVHGVLGLSASALVDAMGVYQQALVERVTSLPLRVADRAALVQVINVRLKNELKFQVDAIEKVRDAYMQWLAGFSGCVLESPDLSDCLDRCVDTIAALPGIAAAAWSRVEPGSGAVVAHSSGGFDAYRDALAKAGLRTQVELDSAGDDVASIARAWRAAGVVTTPTYVNAAYPPAWHAVAHAQGIRSSAACAIVAGPRRGMLLSIYSRYPAHVDADYMRYVLHALHRILTRAARLR